MNEPDHGHPVGPGSVRATRARLLSPDDAARLASLLSVLADPIRSRVLYALDVVEELCMGDTALALEVNEDRTGYALRLLRTAGLVAHRKEGRVGYYRLADDFPNPCGNTACARSSNSRVERTGRARRDIATGGRGSSGQGTSGPICSSRCGS